ncbi:nucleotidyltransferase domain-containing protein [Streptomyces endophyticus]|uniref:Nucleotidyltransferase domain-containing protein n=1 Tax=Streptomyces endophyticus TaxID=714166 RepID=A0ABU6F4R1_9ACTN|nr:nucleotidyltransferase domain-containing protein [Streptomyces endophyticus]MEB8338385.1 nucleotidyltransferase domain-containing protein [Streptomyces endophyticus]
MDHVSTAEQLVRDRFPDARAAFLAGSVLTERRTPRSDLDIVVLLSGPPAPYRESLLHEGWPVELFVQTEADWHRFVEQDIANRRSPLLAMCAEGLLLSDADGIGAALRAEARRRWAAGPPPVPESELEDRRYALTDTLDDLEGCADPLERAYLVAHLLGRASELALLAGGHWLGGGKWLSRRLADADPQLHRRLTAGAAAAMSGVADTGDTKAAGHTGDTNATGDAGDTKAAGDTEAADAVVGRFADVVREVLDAAGGPCWAGYRRD